MGRRVARRDRKDLFCPLAAILLAAAAAASPCPASAAEACGPELDDKPVHIAAITETFDIGLDDGRVLRLAGLDLPVASVSAPGIDPPPPTDARGALETWAASGPIVAHELSATPDRWGRIPVLLYRSGASEPALATLLLAEGLARAKPEPLVHPCFAAFVDAEERARQSKRGLWANPQAGPLRGDDAEALARVSGGFAAVEGILQVHAARGGTLYLTLGRDRWGFAGVLTRRDAARFAKEGLDLRDYAGSPVRLRGDLDDRFGARMLLTDPDQVQSLEPGALDAASPPPR